MTSSIFKRKSSGKMCAEGHSEAGKETTFIILQAWPETASG